jgi:hypothetical protein
MIGAASGIELPHGMLARPSGRGARDGREHPRGLRANLDRLAIDYGARTAID